MMARVRYLFLFVVMAALAWAGVAVAATASVESGSYFFRDVSTGSTTQIVVQEGDQLSITIVDGGGGQRHTVEIPNLGVSSGPLAEGAVFNTPVLATPGTYDMYCQPHRNRGHAVTLVVEANPSTTTTAAPTTTTTAATTTTNGPTTTTTAGTTTTSSTTVTTSSTSSPSTSTTLAASAPSSTTTTATSTDSTTLPSSAGDDVATPKVEVPDEIADGTSGAPQPDVVAQLPQDNETAAAPDELLPVGVADSGDELVWLRSVWFGLLALIPLGAVGGLIIRRR